MYLKAVWLEIYGQVFAGFSAATDPRDPPTSPGPSPHINLHGKSAPQIHSKTKWWRTTNPARLPSDTQPGALNKMLRVPARGRGEYAETGHQR